jgi:Family of unknown function (DUF6599)
MLWLMKFITPLSVTFWAILASSLAVAGAQHTTIVNLASLPKWQVEKSENVSFNQVRQWGVEPLVDREYGVTKVEIRTYRKNDQSLQAVVEKAEDPSSAYGLLTFYQSESMKPEKGMKLTVIGPDQAYMARGAFFVRVLRPSKPKMSEEDFRSALIAIAGAAPSADSMALLPPSLPAQGIIDGSEKYVLGPVAMQRALPFFPAKLVGFRQGAELQAASYRHNGQPLTLILISYPTITISRSHYNAMVQTLGVNQNSGAGALYGKIESSYVLLVQNARSKEIAGRLMSRLTIKQQVSWDQPPPGKPVTVQMFHLILGNILLVSLLVGMAVLGGVLLVVSRRLAAKWFPHSDWARGYEDSIIQLNLK